MSWCINNIYLCITNLNSSIFRIDSDASFFFLVITIHYADLYVLILTKSSSLFEESIYECCLAMINMGNNSNSQVFHKKLLSSRSRLDILFISLCTTSIESDVFECLSSSDTSHGIHRDFFYCFSISTDRKRSEFRKFFKRS